MSSILMTGFPGFLGSQLLPRILRRRSDAEGVCLVQGKFMNLALQRADELTRAHPSLEGRLKLVEGDITVAGLGLPHNGLRQEIDEIYHLAAVYDLSVSRALGMKVNVEGTRHTLDFAADCPGLKRFHYVSTCYVSGRYCGIFTEHDLDKGQRFNNFYEETKYLAEVDVQARMRRGLPATIYRPSIVVGDSHSGETQKYDGPYYLAAWLLRQPRLLAVMPVVGDPSMIRVNLVPRDFVTDAIAHLSGLDASLGKVYQLADPEPLTAKEVLRELARFTGRRVVNLYLPVGPAKWSIRHMPGVYKLLRIPADAIDYFVHPTHYTTTQASADLGPAGITVPHVTTYMGRLIDFMRKNPHGSVGAMV